MKWRNGMFCEVCLEAFVGVYVDILHKVTFFLHEPIGRVMCNQFFPWHHNGRDSISNHQPHDCLLNRLLRRRSKKISKLRVTGLCEGNSPGTGEFPVQRVSNAENVSIWWRHHFIYSHSLGWFTSTGFYCTGATQATAKNMNEIYLYITK